MKNSLIRRSITGVLAVSMVLSAYSCSEKKDGDSKTETKTQPVQTANDVVKNSYSSIDMDVEIPADYIEQMFLVKDTSQVLILGGNGENYSLYLTDMDFSGFNEIPLDFPKTENSQSYLRTTVSPDGFIYALFTLIDYGDFKLPDYEDPDFDYENFDYEAMNEAAQYSCTLYKLGSDGKVVSENPLENLDEYSDDSVDGIHINNLVAGKDGNLVITLSGEEENYLILNEDGKITGKIESNESNHWVNYFTTDSQGNIYCTGYGPKGEQIEYMDLDAKKFNDSEITFDTDYMGINGINTGTGEYNLFVSTRTSLYGVGEDKKPVEIIDWLDSDIKGDSVQHIIGLDDGDFIVYIRDYENNTSGFSRLTKRSADELANQTIITVGMLYNDTEITSKITDFNKSHTDYRIKIADYSKYNEWDDEKEKQLNSASKQLKMDIVSGKSPDMIIVYDYSLISELASKGTFTDLYTYLDKNEGLSKDDIMPNVIKANEIDGKLYSMVPTFSVASFACKSKFCDKENWTIDDLINTMHDNPDMQFMNYGNTKESIFEFLVGSCCDEFIDYKKVECNFNSDDFKKILEFCNEFPDENEQIDWETATDDEIQEYWNEQETMCLNDKALLSDASFYNLKEFSRLKKITFGDDDITLVGVPSSDGKGALISTGNSMAILESSPSKDACWEFIKEFFTEEYQTNERYNYRLPSLVSAFEQKAEDSMHKPYYLDEDGKKVEYEDTYWVNNHEITINPLTEEEKDFVVDYIKKADKVYSGFTDEVREIMVEEVTKYFKGEATSQQTIDKLQNRIGILISEQS